MLLYLLCTLTAVCWINSTTAQFPVYDGNIDYTLNYNLVLWLIPCLVVRTRVPVYFHESDFVNITYCLNKANLRDLLAATCVVILLKLDSNGQFFSPCDLDIWWTISKNNMAPLPCYPKLRASFHRHQWFQTGVTVRKRPIRVKSAIYLVVWPWNLTDDIEKQ